MKKIVSLLLAMMLVIAMAAGAMAATADLTGHTYKAYQIFSGTQAVGSDELGNIAWGSGINGENLLAALKADTTFDVGEANVFAACATAQDVAETMESWADKSENAKAFAAIAYKHIKGEGIACENGITSLEAGYYLVVDDTDFAEGATNTVYNLALLQLTNKGTFEIENKTSVPTVVKKVDDKNDSNNTEDEVEWEDSADYDIGDDVPFQLTATLASNVEDYTTYKIVFHDTLSAGLSYNNDAKVFFNGTDVTSYFTITEESGKLTISCNNVKEFDATNDSVITVEYTAKLDTDANIGSAGNPNTVYLEYSNNPNDEQEGETGNTPEDKVIVFTYKVVVNKVDEQGNALVGAGFTLYKKNDAGEYIAIGGELKGDALTTFTWTGLDDGDYKLVETTTPAGYNTIADILFTITAEHDVTSDDPQLTKLEGGDLFTGDVSTGALSANVENKQGATLPETGGMGTTMMYIGGGLLVAFAVIMLATKRRMNAAE